MKVRHVLVVVLVIAVVTLSNTYTHSAQKTKEQGRLPIIVRLSDIMG